VGLGDLSFKVVTRTVRGVATELHKALQDASPDRVSVELGFDFAVKGSQLVALVVDGEVGASIKVKLEWGKVSSEDSSGESADADADS
jgi:hypothetical protein